MTDWLSGDPKFGNELIEAVAKAPLFLFAVNSILWFGERLILLLADLFAFLYLNNKDCYFYN